MGSFNCIELIGRFKEDQGSRRLHPRLPMGSITLSDSFGPPLIIHFERTGTSIAHVDMMVKTLLLW